MASTGYYPRVERPRYNQRNDGTTPIELDIAERKYQQRGRKQQNNRGRKILTCYGCSKPGHIRRNCRLLGMVPRPQLNVLERKPVVRKTAESKSAHSRT